MMTHRHHPYFKIRPIGKGIFAPRTINDIPWRMVHLCLSYGWPNNLAGIGRIGIVSLGGGYYPADIEQYFKYGNSGYPLPVPTVTAISVDPDAGNNPGNDADIENHLDIMASGTAYSMATGKPANIAVYFADNNLGAISRAILRAVHDRCAIVTISWGSDEANWGHAAAMQMETAAQVATTAGTIVFAASGDNDSSDGGPTPANVDLPASCPHIVGCGGTMRPHKASRTNPETAWNDNPGNANGEGTGGGFSTFFPRPVWQAFSSMPGVGRMVPDVSANADPVTGVHIIYQGQDLVVGGTSFVAPFYAGLFAAIGAKGFIAPKLWQNPLAFNDIVIGDNGMYRCGPGADPVTGLGSPKATALAHLFAK